MESLSPSIAAAESDGGGRGPSGRASSSPTTIPAAAAALPGLQTAVRMTVRGRRVMCCSTYDRIWRRRKFLRSAARIRFACHQPESTHVSSHRIPRCWNHRTAWCALKQQPPRKASLVNSQLRCSHRMTGCWNIIIASNALSKPSLVHSQLRSSRVHERCCEEVRGLRHPLWFYWADGQNSPLHLQLNSGGGDAGVSRSKLIITHSSLG